VIISEVNRYVFIEVPQTASTALASELIENYQGRRILRKHTGYAEFRRTATADERRFRVLATVRNPLDIVVSKFVKARDDHGKLYADHRLHDAPWGYRFRPEARERAFIAKHGPDFARFVHKFYRRIYNNRACLLPPDAYVLHYERLEEDFKTWLGSLGLEIVRPIPRRNITEGRERDFAEWYTGRLQEHASRIFGPYMRRWEYPLPQGWMKSDPSWTDEILFRLDTMVRRFYFHHIHYGWIMPRATRDDSAAPDDD